MHDISILYASFNDAILVYLLGPDKKCWHFLSIIGISKHWAIFENYGPLFQPTLLARIFIHSCQFVVALVSTLVHSTGFIDTVVKWNVDVGLSHDRLFSLLANSFNNNQESALKDYIQNSVMLQYNHCWMISFCTVTQSFLSNLWEIWVFIESIMGSVGEH